jgi:hypothetical protein
MMEGELVHTRAAALLLFCDTAQRQRALSDIDSKSA